MKEKKYIPPPGLRQRSAKTKIIKVLKGFNIMPHETPRSRYDSRYVANRMARTIGHVRLVKSMVEQGADCTDVLIQLAAVRGQLDSICSNLMVQYAEQFAEEYRRSGDPALLDDFKTELAKAVKK